jgi:hypothetical protein
MYARAVLISERLEMREIADKSGRRWQVSEVGYYEIGQPRETEARTAWVHFTSGDETLKLEAPRGLIPSMSDAELAPTVDWLIAHKDVESSAKKMRETTEEDGTTWLITEEGLPGATRGQPGGIALRFISPKGTRYLVPVPSFWHGVADHYLAEHLRQAKPPRKGR